MPTVLRIGSYRFHFMPTKRASLPISMSTFTMETRSFGLARFRLHGTGVFPLRD